MINFKLLYIFVIFFSNVLFRSSHEVTFLPEFEHSKYSFIFWNGRRARKYLSL